MDKEKHHHEDCCCSCGHENSCSEDSCGCGCGGGNGFWVIIVVLIILAGVAFKLIQAIGKKLGLEEYTKFMGNVENPYPYIRKATIVVHTSRFEGKSIAIDESKILCKPIVATNFSTVEDQLTHGVNASICNINPDDVSNSIEKLINDTQLRNKYITYLKNNFVV